MSCKRYLYKHCIKFVRVCPSAPNEQRDVILFVPEVPVMSTSRNFPGFTAYTATYSVRAAAVLGETQASELMSLMS